MQKIFDVTISLEKIIFENFQSNYFTGKNYITERKRALCYIHPRKFYVGFTVRVGAKLRC